MLVISVWFKFFALHELYPLSMPQHQCATIQDQISIILLHFNVRLAWTSNCLLYSVRNWFSEIGLKIYNGFTWTEARSPTTISLFEVEVMGGHLLLLHRGPQGGMGMGRKHRWWRTLSWGTTDHITPIHMQIHTLSHKHNSAGANSTKYLLALIRFWNAVLLLTFRH